MNSASIVLIAVLITLFATHPAPADTFNCQQVGSTISTIADGQTSTEKLDFSEIDSELGAMGASKQQIERLGCIRYSFRNGNVFSSNCGITAEDRKLLQRTFGLDTQTFEDLIFSIYPVKFKSTATGSSWVIRKNNLRLTGTTIKLKVGLNAELNIKTGVLKVETDIRLKDGSEEIRVLGGALLICEQQG